MLFPPPVGVRSPIYAHFTETLGGLSAIRAFGHVNLFARTNERLVDNNFASQFALKVRRYVQVDFWLVCWVDVALPRGTKNTRGVIVLSGPATCRRRIGRPHQMRTSTPCVCDTPCVVWPDCILWADPSRWCFASRRTKRAVGPCGGALARWDLAFASTRNRLCGNEGEMENHDSSFSTSSALHFLSRRVTFLFSAQVPPPRERGGHRELRPRPPVLLCLIFILSFPFLSSPLLSSPRRRSHPSHFPVVLRLSLLRHALQTVDRWLSVRLEMLGNFVVLMATLLSVLAASNGKLVAGLAGLSITNALRYGRRVVGISQSIGDRLGCVGWDSFPI